MNKNITSELALISEIFFTSVFDRNAFFDYNWDDPETCELPCPIGAKIDLTSIPKSKRL